MRFIKNNLIAIICSAIIIGVTLNIDKISTEISEVLEKNPKVIVPETNNYKKNDDFIYVQNSKNFIPLSFNDLINIFYTITNNGYEKFTFYCPSEYKDCLKDVEMISKDPEILTNINNYVHPFNGFSNMKTSIADSGEINVDVNYLYTQEEITKINQVVEEIYQKTINNTMNDYDKIKAIHDYIINHSKYDIERNNNNESQYTSYKAIGPLIEGYATCSGYTDAMAIFLEKMHIKNFKIATELKQEDVTGHVWNSVFIDNKWVHLDLTWDDPVSDDGKDYIQHKYFLITTEELEKTDQGDIIVKDHIFNPRIYPEMKKNA